jgi:hypothetical protein
LTKQVFPCTITAIRRCKCWPHVVDSDIKMKIEGEYELNWLDKLEKKLGRFAIPNLTVYLLAGYVIGFAIYYLAPGLLGWLTLEPAYIFQFLFKNRDTGISCICLIT